MIGNTFNEFLSCIKSLALALPSATLPLNLSKSYISYRFLLKSSAKINSSINFDTISYLCSIEFLSFNGVSIHCLSFHLVFQMLF